MIDACDRAGVILGVGHNRRLWPSMQALKRIARSGELGDILHIEGHFSNEHSNNTAGTWRDSPAESPGGGMTGAGLHILDAFINTIGPIQRVSGQLVVLSRRPSRAMWRRSSFNLRMASARHDRDRARDAFLLAYPCLR